MADEGQKGQNDGMRPVEKKPQVAPPGEKTTVEEATESSAGGTNVTSFYEGDDFNLVEYFNQITETEKVPPPEQIEAWKKEFKGVILVRYPYGLLFIHRILTRVEYRELIYTPFPTFMEREDEIVRRTMLWPKLEVPKNFTGRFSGLPSTLSEYIMDRSGFMNALEVGNA